MRIALILLLLSPFYCFSQEEDINRSKIDSLKQLIQEAEHDSTIFNTWFEWEKLLPATDTTQKFELINKVVNHCQDILNNPELPTKEKEITFYKKYLGKANYRIAGIYNQKGDYGKTKDYYTKSIGLYEEINYTKGVADALNNIGIIYNNQGDYDNAIDYYSRSLKERRKLGTNSSGLANTLTNLGSIYLTQGDYDKAIENYELSLDIREEINDKSVNYANTLTNIGNTYSDRGATSKALEYYFKSVKIREEIGEKTAGYAFTLLNIGTIYADQGEDESALEYYTQSLEMLREIDHKWGISFLLLTFGEIYSEQEDFEKAKDYFDQSLKISEEIGNKSGVAGAMMSNGNIHYRQKNYSKALEYYTQSLKLNEEIGDKISIAESLHGIGNVYGVQGNYIKANQYNKKSLEIAKNIGHLSLVKQTSFSLYEAYKGQGKHRRALQLHEEYVKTRDSLESELNQKDIIRQEFEYTYEKQALADSIQYVQEQRVIKAELANQKQRSSFLFGGLDLSLLFGGFIFNRFRLIRKQKGIIEEQKKLVESERDKSDHLLLNILPKDTAAELKEKGCVAAQSYPMTSVLFTDFKGFSSISEKMSPEELIQELNYCFSKFDDIIQRNNIEKIKTIGDAYMAAAGVPIPNKTHAIDILKAAIEIQSFMIEYAEKRQTDNKPYFEIRIGIHSGPLVAGVVGTQKFQYDVWGDTVNVASRMESNSVVGRVNISESTYQLLKKEEKYKFTSRGKINVKGKGELAMYFVDA